MRGFFSAEQGIGFVAFGPFHLLILFLIVLMVVVLGYYRKAIRDARWERQCRYGLAIVGIGSELALHAWQLGNGIWTYQDSFPVAICFFSLAMGTYVMFTKSKRVFDIAYFWAIGGVVSVLFPDHGFGPDRFRFYQFIIGHISFFLMFMYMLFVHRYVPNGKAFWRSVGLLFGLTVFVILPLNWLTNANFLFLRTPDDTPFEILWGHGYVLYVIGVVVMAFIGMVIWALPVLWFAKKTDRKHGMT